MNISCRDASASFCRRLGPSLLAPGSARWSSSAAAGVEESNVPSSNSPNTQQPTKQAIALTPERLKHQLELSSPADVLRRVFLGPLAIQRSRTINYRMRKNQHDPNPSEAYLEKKHGPTYFKRLRLQDDDGDDSLVVSMDLLRFQIKACRSPEDIMRVVTVACQDDNTTRLLASYYLQHTMAVILSRMDVDRTLETLSVIQARFKEKGVQLEPCLAYVAIRAAASQGHWTALRVWLRIWHDQIQGTQEQMSPSKFDEILIALKAGIEARPLGPSDRRAVGALMHSLHDDKPNDAGHYHLRAHMPEHSPSTMVLWINALREAGHQKEVMTEYETFSADDWWFDLTTKPPQQAASIQTLYTAFTSALLAHYKLDAARTLFARVAYGPALTSDSLWTLALTNPLGNLHVLHEHDAAADTRFADILATRLAAIEARLAIRWIPGPDGTGHHQHTHDHEEAFARLADHRVWRAALRRPPQRPSRDENRQKAREKAGRERDRVVFEVRRHSGRRAGVSAHIGRETGIVRRGTGEMLSELAGRRAGAAAGNKVRRRRWRNEGDAVAVDWREEEESHV